MDPCLRNRARQPASHQVSPKVSIIRYITKDIESYFVIVCYGSFEKHFSKWSDSLPIDRPVCAAPVSANEFFKDSPWLSVPKHRQAHITIEALYPRLGLLGGSSQNTKMSKLAALAAKRRQKDALSSSVSKANPSGIEGVPDVDALQIASKATKTAATSAAEQSRESNATLDEIRAESSKTASTQPATNVIVEPKANLESEPSVAGIRADPSNFAQALLGARNQTSNHMTLSALLENETNSKAFDFTDPSPDDVVTKAQTSKGSTGR